MNPAEIKKLTNYHPHPLKYLGIYWDASRTEPYWYSGRYDKSFNAQSFQEIVKAFGYTLSSNIERDTFWLLINLEKIEASILPWQEAEKLCQQQFKAVG